jgi:hypothetical protein
MKPPPDYYSGSPVRFAEKISSRKARLVNIRAELSAGGKPGASHDIQDRV